MNEERAQSTNLIWVSASSNGALETLRDCERALILSHLGSEELTRGLAALAGSWRQEVDSFGTRAPGAKGWLAQVLCIPLRRWILICEREQLRRAGEFRGLVNHTLQYLARALVASERDRLLQEKVLSRRIEELESLLRSAGQPDGSALRAPSENEE